MNEIKSFSLSNELTLKREYLQNTKYVFRKYYTQFNVKIQQGFYLFILNIGLNGLRLTPHQNFTQILFNLLRSF